MRMPSLDDKENKLAEAEIEIFFITEMGFFGDLKRKQIKFNSRALEGKQIRFNSGPFSNPLHLPGTRVPLTKDNLVDLHLEIVKKIDALIERNERESKQRRLHNHVAVSSMCHVLLRQFKRVILAFKAGVQPCRNPLAVRENRSHLRKGNHHPAAA